MPIALQPATPVALIWALLADSEETIAATREHLVQHFGPLRSASDLYPFDFTTYYAKEMGDSLQKELVCSAERILPSELAAVKMQTIELEKALGRDEGGTVYRRANIDPGLLSIESLALATTKYSGHRICIAPQLYAEITLLYQQGRYRPLEWTYPDYRSEEVQRFLLEVRHWLRETR